MSQLTSHIVSHDEKQSLIWNYLREWSFFVYSFLLVIQNAEYKRKPIPFLGLLQKNNYTIFCALPIILLRDTNWTVLKINFTENVISPQLQGTP